MSKMVHYITRYWNSINGAICKRQKPWSRGQGAWPPEAETLLGFVRSMEITNLPAF